MTMANICDLSLNYCILSLLYVIFTQQGNIKLVLKNKGFL